MEHPCSYPRLAHRCQIDDVHQQISGGQPQSTDQILRTLRGVRGVRGVLLWQGVAMQLVL